MSDFEQEREANIARNRALLAELDVSLVIPKKEPPKNKDKAKPVQPAKRVKREPVTPAPVRQSARLKRSAPDPAESPAKRRKREQDDEKIRRQQEQERLETEERAREAKKPRHQNLKLTELLEDTDVEDSTLLTAAFQDTMEERGVGSQTEFVFDEEQQEREVSELKKKLKGMKVVARAKVTQDRVYSAAYHPDRTKDLIFFGDKHGQLGIWDARAPSDEADNGDDEESSKRDDAESGKYWRLQLHWPATSKSSISTIKFDPIDSHSIFTSSYDCTVRSLSFTTGMSREIYSNEDTLISSIDLSPNGNEMWISDAAGGLTHLDLREDKSKARWYQLSEQKIGSVSVNPVDPVFLLTASNSRVLRVWDTRKLQTISVADSNGPFEINQDAINAHLETQQGKDCLRGEWRHDKSVSSAYWDPHGRRIVSTSYDDKIRLWDVKPDFMKRDAAFPTFRPLNQIRHNCQTGKWLTILKAQWSPNTDVYPHFTVGNMDHSLDIFSCTGDLITRLSDRTRISAVQAVTCSHPSIVERAASGNASGRCVLWAPLDEE